MLQEEKTQGGDSGVDSLLRDVLFIMFLLRVPCWSTWGCIWEYKLGYGAPVWLYSSLYIKLVHWTCSMSFGMSSLISLISMLLQSRQAYLKAWDPETNPQRWKFLPRDAVLLDRDFGRALVHACPTSYCPPNWKYMEHPPDPPCIDS